MTLLRRLGKNEAGHPWPLTAVALLVPLDLTRLVCPLRNGLCHSTGRADVLHHRSTEARLGTMEF